MNEAQIEAECQELSAAVRAADEAASAARKARTALWRRARRRKSPPSYAKLAAWSDVTQNAVIKAVDGQ